MKKKVLKIKIKDSMGAMPQPMDDGPQEVIVKKIKNGFTLKKCGYMNEKDEQFVKDLSKSPTVIARMLKLKDKSSENIRDEYDVEGGE